MKRKTLLTVLLALSLTLCLMFTACGGNNGGNQDGSSEQSKAEGASSASTGENGDGTASSNEDNGPQGNDPRAVVYRSYVAFMNQKNETPLSYEEWLATVKGKDGETPYIGVNGNWYISGIDTGVPAAGAQGPQGDKGEDGVGIDRMEIVNGELIVYYTNGSSQNLGKVSAGGTTKPGDTEDGETVTIKFSVRGGVIIDGEASIQIKKGGTITLNIAPEVERDGYVFKGWSYDRAGAEEWFADEDFDEDTTLYAQWEEKSQSGGNTTDSSKPSGGTTDSSKPSGGTTDSSKPSSGGNTTDSSKPSSGGNTTDSSTTTPPSGGDNNDDVTYITIEYEVGQGGDFENPDDYEKQVEYGKRFTTHPTPINSNPAMLFMGWYLDADCTIAISNSTKYTEDTTLYASWSEQTECSDGSYFHTYTSWETSKEPSCTTPGISSRYCVDCNLEQTKPGNPAVGHKFGSWNETFMAKQRTCQRLGCGETERFDYRNETTKLLGNNPADQINGSTESFYDVPFTNLINNKWDEGYGEYISPRGTGQAYIQFNFAKTTTLDRIYFKGTGVTSINVFVLYEGDSEFSLVGILGSANEKEASPFCEPDSTRKIVAVKFVEENPPQGTSCWQEVAFVKVIEEQ